MIGRGVGVGVGVWGGLTRGRVWAVKVPYLRIGHVATVAVAVVAALRVRVLLMLPFLWPLVLAVGAAGGPRLPHYSSCPHMQLHTTQAES